MASRLSCIIPVYNGAAFIGAALASVAAQTRRPDEIIIVDDGSTDDTVAIISEHPVPCRVLTTAHRGPAHARNIGIAHSDGDLLAFLDADDLWLPEKCAIEAALLADRADVDLVISLIENFIDPAAPSTGDDDWRRPLAGTDQSPFIQCMTARRALFDRIGGFDETISPFGEDTDWFMRAIAGDARIERLGQVHARRRLHHGNLTRHFDNAARLDTAFALMARHLRRKRA